MIQITVDSIEVYAMLNYIRDRTTMVDGEAIMVEPWNAVREEYIEEAKADPDIVLTLDETKAIIKALR